MKFIHYFLIGFCLLVSFFSFIIGGGHIGNTPYSVIGTILLVLSIGLFLKKDRARQVFIILSALFLIFLYIPYCYLIFSNLDDAGQAGIGIVALTPVGLISLAVLLFYRRKSVKAMFNQPTDKEEACSE